MNTTRKDIRTQPSKKEMLHQIKSTIHQRLLGMLDLTEAQRFTSDRLQSEVAAKIGVLLGQEKYPLSGPDKQQLQAEVLDEIFGLGPLEPYLRDHTVSDILVNGPRQVYIERLGRLERTGACFQDNTHLMRVIQRIGTNVGRRIDENSPMLDARLTDGSRVNAIIPPLSLDGPALSIRRFGNNPIDIDRLIQLCSLTAEMAFFLQSCVQARCNILISGGTGSGKTTLLNALSHWIPEGERVVTIEDAAELRLQREHVVRLETRPANIENKGQVTQRDLLRNSLRMRPDRIIIGEVRGHEALDMLQAMNTGHDGSMTTVHANNPRDALRRVENMVSMAGINYPVKAIREQITSALDILVHIGRLVGGARKMMNVSEITGMEGDLICLNDVYRYHQLGVDEAGSACGRFECSGVRPRLVERLRAAGITLPPDMFQRRILETPVPAQEEKGEDI